jgi:formylglycine-generating enzyme required for sulfatase activity
VQIRCDAKPNPRFPSEAKRRLAELVFEDIQRAGGTERNTRDLAESLLRTEPGLDTIERVLARVDLLASETGLLRFEERRGDKGEEQRFARPWHRRFQEYLCACRLNAAAGSVDEVTDQLVGTVTSPGVMVDPAWEGVVTFLFGVHVERGTERAEAYLTRLLRQAQGQLSDIGTRHKGRLLGVGAHALAENPQITVACTLRDELRHEIAARFSEEGARWPVRDRLLALEALGRLGDPRLDEDRWVDIPDGTYTMGGDKQAYDALPKQKMKLEPFRMMWRPVTVQDFESFVKAKGYEVDDWWEAGRAGGQEPEDWQSQLYHPNRPVVGVSWYEAKAFCRWASVTWKLDIDLPTEPEWEAAARGLEANPFPWGKEEPIEKADGAQANFMGIARGPSPIGAFPFGNRGRLVDLAGNVWEWCRDVWTEVGLREKSRERPPPDSPRVVRGGSWSGDPRFLRCATRSRLHPRFRDDSFGFRVVWRGALQH